MISCIAEQFLLSIRDVSAVLYGDPNRNGTIFWREDAVARHPVTEILSSRIGVSLNQRGALSYNP